MNYVLTGHKGLIGEYLKKRLDKENWKCMAHIDTREGFNILNLKSLELNPETQPVDIFIHAASFCKINKCIENPELSHLNNTDGVFECLEFCRLNGIKKFMFFSSSRVLSKEVNPYTASKMYGEMLCKAYKECYDIDYIIVRPSTVYGPCHDLTSRLITTWVINAMSGKSLICYGKAHTKTLDFTYVDDFVDAIMLLINEWETTKNEDFNISGEEETSLLKLFYIIQSELDKLLYINEQKSEIAQPQKVNVDTSKIKLLGFKPKINLKEGIKRLVEFYKTEGKEWIKN